MVNEWIEKGLHPITGIREDFRRLVTKEQKRVHTYDYELDVKI
jgi:hypothetical protein